MKMDKCEICGETAEDFLVKHHVAKGKTTTLCGNCHIKEHREHPSANYKYPKQTEFKDAIQVSGHIIKREVTTPVTVLSENIVFGFNTNGTLSIVAKTSKNDYMINLRAENIKKLKDFLNKAV